MLGAERDALEIASFLESHEDAELLPGGKVRCTTTGHEMPLDMYWLRSHWEGKKYAKAAVRAAARSGHHLAKTSTSSSPIGANNELSTPRIMEEVAAAPAPPSASKKEKKVPFLSFGRAKTKSKKKAAHDPTDELAQWTMADVEKIDIARAKLNGSNSSPSTMAGRRLG